MNKITFSQPELVQPELAEPLSTSNARSNARWKLVPPPLECTLLSIQDLRVALLVSVIFCRRQLCPVADEPKVTTVA